MKQPPTLRWQKKSSPIDKALDNAQWRKFRDALQAYNPTCQRIENGVRCSRAGKIAHHLVGRHTNPSLMYAPSNVVMVCQEHHPSGSDGEPQDSQNEYAPTRWLLGAEFPHPQYVKLKPGEVRIGENGVAKVG